MPDNVAIQAEAEAAQQAASNVAEALAEHETENDEDYAWLTDRLDALSRENAELRALVTQAMEQARQPQSPSPELLTAMQAQQELTQTLRTLLETTQAQLTSLSETVSLRLTPPTSTSSLQTEDSNQSPTETQEAQAAEASESGASEATQEQRERAEGKKRRRI